MAELMNQGKTRQDRPIAHMHMARQRRVVDQDAMVANDAVMTDMGIGHHQVVITQRCFRTVLNGSAMNGDTFTNNVVVTDHQASFFALVLQIRGVLAYR